MNQRIPPGLLRCDTCGEFSGTTFEKYLAPNPQGFRDPTYDPERAVTALCRCHGSLCRGCSMHRIPRPMSGHYHRDINRVLYVPSFAACVLCDSCASRSRLERLGVTHASLGPGDKAVHIPCALRPGNSSRQGGLDVVTLESERIAWIIAMMAMPTYASLVSGLPDPDSDAELILQARRRASALWGARPTHVVVPEYEFAYDAGRTHLRMPPWQYYVWLESGPIKGSVKESSQLVVIWFGQRNAYQSLLEFVRQSLRSLPWDNLAGGCDR